MGSDNETSLLSLLCYVYVLGDLMMQLILIILTKRKATVVKDLDKCFYRSNENQCTYRKRITHPHHEISTNIPI
jgi:hypothetical protein